MLDRRRSNSPTHPSIYRYCLLIRWSTFTTNCHGMVSTLTNAAEIEALSQKKISTSRRNQATGGLFAKRKLRRKNYVVIGCLLAIGASVAPRLILILSWIFGRRWDLVWDGNWIVPLLGIIALPYTTIMYLLVWSPAGLMVLIGFGSAWACC